MKILSTLLLVLALGLIAKAQSLNPLAGNYAINRTKSDFAGVPAWTLPAALKVSTDDGKLTFTRLIVDQSGTESDRNIALGTGTRAEYNSPNGSKNKATITWTADHSGITLD